MQSLLPRASLFRAFTRAVQTSAACRDSHVDRYQQLSNGEHRNVLQARGTLLLRQDNGEPTNVKLERTGKLRKSDVCRQYCLQPRDLGALDSEAAGRRAQIFVRPGSIVYSASIRAVIRSDRVLLLEDTAEGEEDDAVESHHNAQNEHSDAAKTLQGEMRLLILKDELSAPDLPHDSSQESRTVDATPFEFIALEALLAQTTKGLFRESTRLQQRFDAMMKDFSDSDSIPTSGLQSMLEIKDAAEDFRGQAEEFKDAVSNILREEPDMKAMYLTDLANGKERSLGDDDGIELLMENYRHHAYYLSAVARTLQSRLQSVNNHITLLLSSTRNRLLNLEITIAFASLGVGMAAFVGAIFGMNLTSGLEDEPHLFLYATGFSILLAGTVVRMGRRALYKARAVKGEQLNVLKRPSTLARRY